MEKKIPTKRIVNVRVVEKDESEKLVVTEEEKRKTIEFITEYLKEKKDRSQKEEKRVLKHMRPQSLYRVIERNTVFTNKEKMINALIETGDIEYMYKAAILMKREDNIYISRIQDYIMKSGQVEYIIDFACNIQNADMDKLEDTIIALGDAKYIYEFLVKVMASKGKVNVEKLVNAIIATKNAKYIYELAVFIQNLDEMVHGMIIKYSQKLEDAIVNTYGTEYIALFARDIRWADKERLEDTVMDNKDVVGVYYFALYIDVVDIEDLEDIVVESNNVEYMSKFYEDIESADKERLVKAIYLTDDKDAIDRFEKERYEATKVKQYYLK